MKKTATKMTLDKLATMVAKGFAHVDEKMTGMVTKEEMNQKFEKVDKRFENIEESLQSIRHSIIGQGDKFVSQHEFERHVTRFNALEAKVKAKIK